MSPLNLELATNLARARIDELAESVESTFELLSESTVEIRQGWIFFYNSAEFVKSGDMLDALAGNGPILVTREGVIHELPSAIPWEDAVKLI
jgi:hypothetical protein